ncbi:Permease of the drug/metabolite transporter (DMT) superfamily [Crocosphaera watsonii WH 0402]|uniref:Permease of the drug/metabolite transporter (DMT) superfamily n=1 Tax=Crocosphaera watsonii WH 0402 TaxID=1284629 RepID=T2JXU3_CROWT|nr:Permease of the drug/metabolite transporter (DMT) superfamily [Crocosphaera watsonii WH 0402]
MGFLRFLTVVGLFFDPSGLEIVGFWGLSLGLGGLFLPAFLAGLTLFCPLVRVYSWLV